MSKRNQEVIPQSFDDLANLVDSEIHDFYSYVNVKSHDSDNLTSQIYFELKARVKYAENLWDMYVSSFKERRQFSSWPESKTRNDYFKAIGKAKMLINKFATENKIWE